MFTEHVITLNIVPGDVPPVAHVSQYDVGREIRITLLDGSKGFELSPDYSYTLVGTKSSGKGFSYDDILELTNNALLFKTTGQMTVADGPVVCGIIIMDGDEHVETLSFILEVHRSALTTDTIIDSDDFHSIIQDEVRAYLERTGILIDRYLRVQGAAADAKATGDAFELKVDKPVSNPNGESGQFLRTNGDGTTIWADAAMPTDSQIGEAVQDWLDNHPEATLNVEDGSVTFAKLSDGVNTLLDEVTDLDENYAAVDFENVDTAGVSTGFARRLLTDQGMISDEDTAKATLRNGYLTGVNVVGDSITDGTLDGNKVQMVNIPASQIVGGIARSQIADGSIDLSALTSGVTDEIDSALAIAGLARQEIAATNENISNFESSVTSSISDLQDQIDGAIETWFYDGVPSSNTEPEVNWTTTDEKNNHLGDLYYDSETGYCYRYQLNDGSYEWHLIADNDISTALAAAAAAQDTADSKRRVFYTQPTPPYDQGDLWVQGSDGDILRCQTAKAAGGVFAPSDWVLASKYTDDTVASQAYSIANGKSTAYYQATEPTGGTYTVNDIWFETDNDNKMYSWDGTQWVPRLLDTNALDDGAITAEKIYAGAVTTGKIAAGAVTTNELAADAVTATKISAGAITADKMESGSVTVRMLADENSYGDNLFINTLKPDASTAANYPRLIGQSVDTYTTAGTVTTAQHGMRLTNTAATRPIIRWGAGSGTNASLNGLTAGQTYTIAFDYSCRLYSGTISGSTTSYLRLYKYDDEATAGTQAINGYKNVATYTSGIRGTELSGSCIWTFTVPSVATSLSIRLQSNGTTASFFTAGDFIEVRNLIMVEGSFSQLSWVASPKDSVSSTELVTPGATVINGANITTGTIDVNRINLYDKLHVYSDNTQTASTGGYMGFMNGTEGFLDGTTVDTDGMAISDVNGENYLIVTGNDPSDTSQIVNGGVRMTAKRYYLDTNNTLQETTSDVYLSSNNFVINNASAYLNGSTYVRGTIYDRDQSYTTIRPWVIFENASSTSVFPACTLPPSSPTTGWTQDDIDAFSANVKKFCLFYVEIRRVGEAGYGKSGTLIYVPQNGTEIARPMCIGSYSNRIDSSYRDITINRSTGQIIFGNGYSAGGTYDTVSGTKYAVPTLILGFNPQNRS